jgi:outer membrane protein assembly factor BamC
MIFNQLKNYRTLLLLMPLLLSGCSYIKGLFPDKERDYQFRTEIAELTIPDDLKSGSSAGSRLRPAISAAEPSAAAVGSQDQPVAKAPLPKAETAKPKAKAQEEPVTAEEKPNVQVAVSSAAVSSLQIDQPKLQAWRLVARALGQQKVEVVERNLDNAFFYVRYDPNEVKAEDNSIWDEFNFMFGDDPSHEKEYRVSLLEVSAQLTEVTVQNSDGTTISDAPATRLLKLIADGIKQDVPTNTQEAP